MPMSVCGIILNEHTLQTLQQRLHEAKEKASTGRRVVAHLFKVLTCHRVCLFLSYPELLLYMGYNFKAS